MPQEVRRAILESGDEVIGSFPVQWSHCDPPLRGRLSADPEILVTLFDRPFTLTGDIGTIVVRFIDEDGAFVLSSAHLAPHGEVALTAAAASGR